MIFFYINDLWVNDSIFFFTLITSLDQSSIAHFPWTHIEGKNHKTFKMRYDEHLKSGREKNTHHKPWSFILCCALQIIYEEWKPTIPDH